MISRIAARVFLAALEDTPVINTFEFSIPLRWNTYPGGLLERSGETALEYTLPVVGKMSMRITGSVSLEALPSKSKVDPNETDSMLLEEIRAHKENARPEDVTTDVYYSGFNVEDAKGEFIPLLNRRTGMVVLLLAEGLFRTVLKDLTPSKISGMGFMVPIQVFRAKYRDVPEFTLEDFPEALEAILTHVEKIEPWGEDEY